MSVDRDIVALDPYIDTGGFIIMLLPVRGLICAVMGVMVGLLSVCWFYFLVC